MSPRRLFAAAGAATLALALAGCISVLPKTKPDQLYSFGHGVEAAPAAAATNPTGVGVLLQGIGFPRAATGDGILTMTGTQSAYLAQSRWVGPASVLFREAVERAFERGAGNVRLLARGEAGKAGLMLRLEVLDFEATYPNGLGTIPAVVVGVRGRLTQADGTFVAEKLFEQRKSAADNRVGPIVAAYDEATSAVLKDLVAWTDQNAGVAKR